MEVPGWRRWGELLLVPGRAVGGGPADPDAGSGDVAVMGESAGPRGPVTAWGGGGNRVASTQNEILDYIG